MHDACIGGSAVVLGPIMSNVCHTFGPQGAPRKLQAHVIPIAAEWAVELTSSSLLFCKKFGVNLCFHSSWFRLWLALLSKRLSSAWVSSLTFIWTSEQIWLTHSSRSTSLSSFYTLLMDCVFLFVYPNWTPLLSCSGLTEEKTGFPLSTATVQGLSSLGHRPVNSTDRNGRVTINFAWHKFIELPTFV